MAIPEREDPNAQIGEPLISPDLAEAISARVLSEMMRKRAIENYVAAEVTNEGGILDQLAEGVAYRGIFLHQVYAHWIESRMSREARDAFEGSRLTDPELYELGMQLYLNYYRFSINRAGDHVLRWHEEMRLMHVILATVYGISYDNQQQLTQEIGAEWISQMGTQVDIFTNSEFREKAGQEAEVLKAYLDQYVAFKTRHFDAHRRGLVRTEDRNPREQLLSSTTAPGSAMRQVYFTLLYMMYDLDPRKREAALVPTDDPTETARQEALLNEEAEWVDAIIAFENEQRKPKQIELGKYLN